MPGAAGDDYLVATLRSTTTRLTLRANVVLRWEYAADSTWYLVWQHGRSLDRIGAESGLSAFDGLGDAPRENVLLLKAGYWLSLQP